MTSHDDIVDLLAVRRDLSAEERLTLSRHLKRCSACSHVAAVYDRQDELLGSLGRAVPRTPVRAAVSARIEPRPRHRIRHRFLPWRWLAAGSIALTAIVVTSLLFVLSPRTATPVSASVIHILTSFTERDGGAFPYSGSSIVSYDQALLDGNFPAASRAYSSRYRLVVQWSVRDLRHYRIDVTTELPAIQAGTVTYVRNGERLLVYDHRSERAIDEDLTAFDNSRQPLGTDFSTSLLTLLQNGGSLEGPQPPTPAQTIRQYLATLRMARTPQHPPEYARLVGRTTVLGQPVDIVDFGPLQRFDYITGCSFQHPGHCLHHPSGQGGERLWVDLKHHAILGYEELGAMNASDSLFTAAHMRVLSVTFGTGPTQQDLQYRPPVPVQRVSSPNVGVCYCGAGTGGQYMPPPPLFDPSGPAVQNEPTVPEFHEMFPGPTGSTAELDQVWGTGTLGRGDVVVGPYVELQERVQVHGLPQLLRTAREYTVGRCTTYAGRNGDGQRWLAMQHGAVSVLVSTNALTERQLVQYAGQALCGKAS